MIPWPEHPAFDLPAFDAPREDGRRKTGGPKNAPVKGSDLLSLPPLKYADRRHVSPLSAAVDGGELFFQGVVTRIFEKTARTGKPFLLVKMEDQTPPPASCGLWFFNGVDFLRKRFAPGKRLAVHGTAAFKAETGSRFKPEAMFTHPDVFDLLYHKPEDLLGVFPVYGPLKGVKPALRKERIDKILDLCQSPEGPPKVLPAGFLEKHSLKDPTILIQELHRPHFPSGEEPPPPKESPAFRELSLLELVIWRYLILREKERRQGVVKRSRPDYSPGPAAEFVKLLPFALSAEQIRVTDEIRRSLKDPSPANRLLQGEVGSGKTAVAAELLFENAAEGRQGALIAPTELLSRQHYDFLKPYADKLKVPLVLLTGSTPAAERRTVLRELETGMARIAVGTQALLSPRAVFRNLTLAVVDEQHRFGVRQRMALRLKNPEVDLVALSATPIPRSLAQALYGDMDISSMRGTLPGRMTPETRVFGRNERREAYALFAKLAGEGGQAFAVSPRIGKEDEDQDEEDAAPQASRGPSLAEMEKEIRLSSPGLRIGTLHGRLETLYRSEVMDRFKKRDLDVLLSTTIVEVGVDVQGATVMLIEGAENLGLAQLHQLRGRIGRGGGRATLILVPHAEPSSNALARFAALTGGADGYALAELDLNLRGPGEELGLRQSGWPKFSFCRFPRDLSELPRAEALAEDLKEFVSEFSEDFQKGLKRLGESLAEAALGV
ncbi:MAG: DEAD/DEAH box helicase [Deltaproteobacteria bacterium]|jgi:ATP-dependent DNA helicase RecG|nr:DEAD/DEAH box helicase [Deltaproteobacteria bacterium]